MKIEFTMEIIIMKKKKRTTINRKLIVGGQWDMFESFSRASNMISASRRKNAFFIWSNHGTLKSKHSLCATTPIKATVCILFSIELFE